MQFAIFGIGRVFYRYWPHLDREQVVCLIDNDTNKIGGAIDGVEIISPDELKRFRYDGVLILSVQYHQMKKQLMELGIPEDVIYHHGEIGNLLRRDISIYKSGQEYSLEQWLDGNQKKRRIFLLSHEMTYTGAPIALLNMAKVMRDMGCAVVYAGMIGGALVHELTESGLEYIDGWGFVCPRQQKEALRKFGMAVICTYGLKMCVREYSDLQIPILWWLHEAENHYKNGAGLFGLGKNVHIYCGGERARRIFESYHKGLAAQVLQYCVPREEEAASLGLGHPSEKIRIALVGMICKRKAQGVLLRAVSALPAEYQEQIEVLIVGSVLKMEQSYWDEQQLLLRRLKNIKVMGEMPQKELARIYQGMDVLVCPSKDDPMPIVVTQAMMYGKACIISENVGQAEFIRQGENGFVFQDEIQLTELLKWLVDNREKLSDMGGHAREIYEQNFSERAMEEKLRLFMKENVRI
ncbi:MAG: glycosyltransferase family 4 protein [Lachnospiraceae bacterium]|nr:glycosyltransferase family 4 protein [Lachnospiraceae bacterium]